KAFRVFNKRTRRVEENLHIEFLENGAIEKGTKDAAYQEVKKDVSSLRYIVLPNWAHDALLESSSKETPSLDNILSLKNRFEDILGVTTSSDETIEVEADVSNMETSISASPTPTLRIHKDHPKSQIIGPVDTPMQTRHKSKMMEEQSFIATIHQKTDPTLLQIQRFQQRYIKLKKLCMDYMRLLEPGMGKDGTGKDVELNLYRSMIGSLMYLTASRPDVMFAICACARHQVTPKECHLHAVKKIFRYLKGHLKLGLWYPKASPFDLVAYSDSDYGGSSQDPKSTTRGSQFLGRRLISWQCKKQTIVATSTTEAEYVAAASCYGQVLWIQN
nr:hypothetical protein [Tanacetum cinerariifolium]